MVSGLGSVLPRARLRARPPLCVESRLQLIRADVSGSKITSGGYRHPTIVTEQAAEASGPLDVAPHDLAVQPSGKAWDLFPRTVTKARLESPPRATRAALPVVSGNRTP